MIEFLWFAGGAVVYQLLIKLLRITQLYMFFQEIHVHALMMLDAASQDLETAVQLKSELLEESSLEEEDLAIIFDSDEQAIKTWKTTAIVKMHAFIPNAFKSSIKYDDWNGMKKYLRDIIKP
jgi:hypothetical protein